jgi:hypothetical protein
MIDLNGFSGEPDEVPYGETCSCHPKNGGNGICGCVMGSRMVPNPKKYGQPKTNFTTTTDFNITIDKNGYIKELEKRDAESIVEKNRKINILNTLIQIVESEHPEFKEEHTTGWDLIENAKLWLEELKNK